jgi:hypothetical protein
MILNLKGTEGTLNGSGTGNTFFNATCIKLNVTAESVIEIYNSEDTLLGNTTLLATNTYFVEKAYDDKIRLVSGTAPATPVGFTIS